MHHSPVRALSGDEISLRIDELCEVLESCVAGGASVSFMHPLSRDKAFRFWSDVAASVTRGERLVLIAEEATGAIVGTVQLVLDQPENQPHRADVSKLLVHERARRLGLAGQLMARLESEARRLGKNVLVLDTATGSGAENFYRQAGWQYVGEIPRYALMPHGNVTGTTIFYKLL